jgi:hypothetical protein
MIRRWPMRPGLAVRGEAPTASHLLYTQPGILRDDVPAERKLGIDAGLAWRDAAEVYVDRGISSGMQYGIEAARAAGRPIEIRRIEAAGNRDADTASARPAA